MILPRSAAFSFAPLMPVAKVGFPLPTPFFPNGYRKGDFETSRGNSQSFAPRASIAAPKHTFVINALKKRGVFKPRPYIYCCLGCGYIFLVNEQHGLIVAVDRKAQPLPDPENSKRLATFAHGPCPAAKSATRSKFRETVDLSKPQSRPAPSGILALLARFGAKTRYPYFVEANLQPPDGITPQDLLS